LSKPPLTDRFLNWSKRTLALGLPVEDEPLRLLWAMTLGWRTALTGDISEPFLRAGTMHLFAIDGLRIALISGMLVALLRVLRVSRAWCGSWPFRLIWFYTAATGWESSAIRASVMMTVVLGGWALKRPGDTVNSLAAAAFIILLWEPRQLFEASFQLSFFVVLVIALMLPPLNKISDRLWQRSVAAERIAPALAARADRDAADVVALLRALVRGVDRLDSAFGKVFSPVQPRFNAGEHRRRAARHARADEQPRRLVCGTWFPWATELFNHSAWFFMWR
jgi:ComEC/Rec2-related protein